MCNQWHVYILRDPVYAIILFISYNVDFVLLNNVLIC